MCRYYVLVLAIITPFFAVANAYGTGLTDFDMSSVYGTVSLLLSAAHLRTVFMTRAVCLGQWAAAFQVCMETDWRATSLVIMDQMHFIACMKCVFALQVIIFVFAVWTGAAHGGVIAGLAVAGFVMAATSSAGTLMQVLALLPPWMLSFGSTTSTLWVVCVSSQALRVSCLSLLCIQA